MPKHELIKHIVDKVDSIAVRSQPYAKKQGMLREKKYSLPGNGTSIGYSITNGQSYIFTYVTLYIQSDYV